MSYDAKCYELAESFLSDSGPYLSSEVDQLAHVIQDAIEDWFSAKGKP